MTEKIWASKINLRGTSCIAQGTLLNTLHCSTWERNLRVDTCIWKSTLKIIWSTVSISQDGKLRVREEKWKKFSFSWVAQPVGTEWGLALTAFILTYINTWTQNPCPESHFDNNKSIKLITDFQNFRDLKSNNGALT